MKLGPVTCQNSININHIDMKLGPVTKLDKKNKTASKKLAMMSCWEVVMALSFFQFMTNFEEPGI